jgi:hypothetical protein
VSLFGAGKNQEKEKRGFFLILTLRNFHKSSKIHEAALWSITVNVTNAKIRMGMKITYHPNPPLFGQNIGNKTACG